MSAHLVLGMWFQGTDAGASTGTNWLVVFVGVIAFCSFVQFLVVVGAAIGALKAYASAKKALTEVKGKAYPMVASVQGVVNDLRPKVASITESVRVIVEDAKPKVASVTENVRSIVEDATPKVKVMTENVKTISNNFAETTTTFKEKAQSIAGNVSETVEDANKRTRAQVDRVDGIISSAFTATGEIAAKIQHGIKVPVNEVVGWVNGAKASLDKFLSHQKSATKAGPVGVPRGASGRRPSSGSQSADILAGSGFPESSTGSTAGGRGFGAERYQAAAARAAEQDVLSDPSSMVAPSPGAQEVVDRFREAMKKDDTTKPV